MINMESVKAKLKELDDYYKEHPEELRERLIEDAEYIGYETGWWGHERDKDFAKDPKVQDAYDWGHWIGWTDRQIELGWDLGDIQ